MSSIHRQSAFAVLIHGVSGRIRRGVGVFLLAGSLGFLPALVLAEGPPLVTSSTVILGEVERAISYGLTFDGEDGSSVATVTGLPAGLSFDSATRSITGSVDVAGLYQASGTVNNSDGVTPFDLSIAFGDRDWIPPGLPVPYDLDFLDLAFGHAGYVGAATDSHIFFSVDGMTWSSIYWSHPKQFYAAAYGDGTYLVAGGRDVLLRSSDGVSWLATQMPAGGNADFLYGAAFGDGTFVVVGTSGRILSSPDGDTWTARVSGTTSRLWSVAFLGGKFVATGDEGTIVTSPDGVTWSVATTGTTTAIRAATFGEGVYLATGQDGLVLSSADGLSWLGQSSPTFESLYGAAFGDGQFVIAGPRADAVFSSPDGVQWTPRSPRPEGVWTFTSKLRFFDDRFFAVSSSVEPLFTGGDWRPWLLALPDVAVALGEPVSIDILATDQPIEFLAGGLPDGVEIDGVSGVISGEATEAGRFEIAFLARNTSGYSAPRSFVIDVVAPAPSQPVYQGGSLSLTAPMTGEGMTYQWYRDGAALAGETGATLEIANAGHGDMGFYLVVATDIFGEQSSAAIPLVVMESFVQWADRMGLAVGEDGPGDVFGESGVSNLLAYMLGFEGGASEEALRIPGMVTDGSDVCYRATIPKSVYGIDWHFEKSEDMASWSGEGYTLRLVEDTGLVETWEARCSVAGGASGFFRLCVETE